MSIKRQIYTQAHNYSFKMHTWLCYKKAKNRSFNSEKKSLNMTLKCICIVSHSYTHKTYPLSTEVTTYISANELILSRSWGETHVTRMLNVSNHINTLPLITPVINNRTWMYFVSGDGKCNTSYLPLWCYMHDLILYTTLNGHPTLQHPVQAQRR